MNSWGHLCIFVFCFTLPGRSDFGKNFRIVSTHTKLHVQAKKITVLDFHRVHDVWLSPLGSVNTFEEDSFDTRIKQIVPEEPNILAMLVQSG